MAPSRLAKLLLLSILVAVAAVSARDLPHPNKRNKPHKPDKKADVKQPEFLVTGEPQPTVLIPGMGRYLLPPKCKKPLYPYNPVTGAPLSGGDLPSVGGQVPGPHTQIPGGDDTFVPNPASNSAPTPTPPTPTPSGSGAAEQAPPVPQP